MFNLEILRDLPKGTLLRYIEGSRGNGEPELYQLERVPEGVSIRSSVILKPHPSGSDSSSAFSYRVDDLFRNFRIHISPEEMVTKNLYMILNQIKHSGVSQNTLEELLVSLKI